MREGPVSAGAADGVASLYRVHSTASADDRSSLNSTVHLRGHPGKKAKRVTFPQSC